MVTSIFSSLPCNRIDLEVLSFVSGGHTDGAKRAWLPVEKLPRAPCKATALAYALQLIRNHEKSQHATLCDPF